MEATVPRHQAQLHSCALLALSSELQMIILNCFLSKNQPLFLPIPKFPKWDEQTKEEESGDAQDVEHASALLNLSWTCKFYRSLLAPYIFATIILRDNKKSATSVAAVASSSHRKHVRKLYFIGSAIEDAVSDSPSVLKFADVNQEEPEPDVERQDEEEEEEEEEVENEQDGEGQDEDEHDVEEQDEERQDKDEARAEDFAGPSSANVEHILPSSVQAILANLNGETRHFPNLETVIVEFDLDDEEWSDHWGFDVIADEYETAEETLRQERRDTWRALTYKTFTALAENSNRASNDNDRFTELQIFDLPPKPCSALTLPTWHKLLSSSITQFTLRLPAWENGAGWELNTCVSTLPWTESFAPCFFDHLVRCEELTLHANSSVPLGMGTNQHCNHCHLAVRASHMPLLRWLDLSYLVVSEQLAEVLIGHAKTLESVVLQDCFASMSFNSLDDDDDEYAGMWTWARMFDAFAAAWPRRLVEFRVESGSEEIGFEVGGEDEAELEDVQKTREKLEEERVGDDGGLIRPRRLWKYANVDDKYGMLLDDTENVRTHFLKGEDQRAFDVLMDIVEVNTKEARP